MKTTIYDKLDPIQKRLINEAQTALKNAYNPYSHFAVGAALLSGDGQIITAANVENASYGLTICAERSALVRANAMGLKKTSKIAIIGGNDQSNEISGPCGACRQMIFEAAQISKTDIEVIMSDGKKENVVTASISELLPLAFGPKNLGINLKKFRAN
jgi:cytidine deaminase